MRTIMTDITDYLDYLIKEHDLFITVHSLDGDPVTGSKGLIRYNFHINSYCRYIKSVCGTWNVCIAKQANVAKRCIAGEFFGTCYAGVSEFVYPIKNDDKVTGFICVSGYRGENEVSHAKLDRYAEKYSVGKDALLGEWRSGLSSDIPSADFIGTLIHPLQSMFKVAYDSVKETLPSGNSLINDVIHYINQHHTDKITMDSISRVFHCSVSTLSHSFKKECGVSISEYITHLRLEEAAWFLSSSSLSLIEISSVLGFGTSNYFSTVFKKRYGVSPKVYREKYKTEI